MEFVLENKNKNTGLGKDFAAVMNPRRIFAPRSILVAAIIMSLFSSFFLASAERMEFVPASVTEEKAAQADSEEAPDQVRGDSEKNKVPDELVERDRKFLNGIKSELSLAQKEREGLEDNIKEIEERIEILSNQSLSLRRQLALIGEQIAHTELMIANVQQQVSAKEAEIAVLEDEIEVRELEMKELKQVLAEYLQAMYMQRNEYIDFSEEELDKTLKLLFAGESVSDVLQSNFYYAFLEEKGNEVLEKLMIVRGILNVKRGDLEAKQEKLQLLRYQLKEDQERYRVQKAAKEQILVDTHGKEAIYQELVAQSRAQQEAVQQEILALRDNVTMVEKNMEKYGDYFDVEHYRKLVNREVGDLTSLEALNGEVDFKWPVPPVLGISAYFRDPSYVGVFGVRHNAIDVPVGQGSPVRSIEDGVIYKARDNGYGYSYIVVAHRSGYMSLYGHISKIGVEVGEKVHKGQIIGLSGGAPGTRGAGYMTTGAHLHLEVFHGGKHIDPLSVLPLGSLPLSAVPEKYLDRL